ncbi:MAG: threonine/serine exporter ThrE family protein [Succinivibrionaceae bacterium]
MHFSNIDFAKLLLLVAHRLAMSGAETRLIVQITERIAKAYHYPSVETIVNPEEIMIVLHNNNQDIVQVAKNKTIGINMYSLTAITSLCLKAEEHTIDILKFKAELEKIKPYHYPDFVVALAVALASAGFVMTNDGNFKCMFVSFCAGLFTIIVKLLLQKFKFFMIFVFAFSGFCATLSSYFFAANIFNCDSQEIRWVLFVSVLMLVPGFPFMNGVLDIFKGYLLMGFSRLVTALIIVLSVCMGIMVAMSFLPGKIMGWNF